MYPFRRYVAKEVTLFRKKKIFSLFIVTSLPALRLIDKMGNDETHIIHRILKGETSLYEYFLDKYEGGNLAASKIRNLECPNYEICLIDYGCGKFNRKIHIMEQYP